MVSVVPSKYALSRERDGVLNLAGFLLRKGIADTSQQPAHVLTRSGTNTLSKYDEVPGVAANGGPVLLVPPLGAQSKCFDLRRGCSLAQHFVEGGRPTYLVDYDELKRSHKDLGIEHWVNDVLPPAIRAVSDDSDGRPVNLVGWCMGGLMSICTAAVHPELPINVVAMVASPFDFSQNPLLAPVRAIGKHTGGRIISTTIKAMGSAPAPVVSAAFKATALPTYAKKPLTLWRRRHDRDFLAQVQAVDGLMNDMVAYPGRATLQAYLRLAIHNELASGKVQGPNKLVDLADVRVPVMNVAGSNDVLAPKGAVHHVGELLPNSPDVRLPDAPGGHLGVLTGTSARETTWAYLDEFIDAHAPTA
jgi:polyhydroxyalkanoate synthase